MDLESYKKTVKEQQALRSAEQKHADQQQANVQLQETIVKSFKALVEYLENRVSKTAVVNQLKEIGTPDAMKVVAAVDSLHETLKDSNKNDGTQKALDAISETMRQVLQEARKIPKEHVKPEKQKFIDYSRNMASLEAAVKAVESAIKKQKTTIAPPTINLPAPKVEVEAPDLSSLKSDLKAIEKAVKKVIIPDPVDNTAIEKELKKQSKYLKEIVDKPSGGSGGGSGRATPYSDSNDIPAFVTLNDDGTIPVANPIYTTRIITNSVDANIQYIGNATVGSATSSAVWRIQEVDKSSGTVFTFADGDDKFDNVWDNRESLSYS